MQKIIEDEALPIETRLRAIREPSFRPTLTGLLRLIRNAATPARLKAAAVVRYNLQLSIKEILRERRQRGNTQAEEVVNPAAELLGADAD